MRLFLFTVSQQQWNYAKLKMDKMIGFVAMVMSRAMLKMNSLSVCLKDVLFLLSLLPSSSHC